MGKRRTWHVVRAFRRIYEIRLNEHVELDAHDWRYDFRHRGLGTGLVSGMVMVGDMGFPFQNRNDEQHSRINDKRTSAVYYSLMKKQILQFLSYIPLNFILKSLRHLLHKLHG